MSNSGIPLNSTLNRTPKVLVDSRVSQNGRIKTIKVTKQTEQLGLCDHLNMVHSQTIKGVPTNLFRNAGAKFSATLEQKSFNKLESLTLHVTLRITSVAPATVCTLALPTYWFDRHEYRASNGSRHLNIVYNDNLHFALTTLDEPVLARYVRAMGFNLTSNVISSAPVYTTNGSNIVDVDIYIPILGGWIDNGDLYWKNIDGDLVYDFYPNKDIRAGGATNFTVDCSAMEFIVQSESLTEADSIVQEKFHGSVASETSFLNVTPINFYSEVITANQKKTFKLDTLNGHYAFLVVYIRDPTLGNAFQMSNNMLDIGDSARIDIVKSSGQSMLGDGTAIPYGYLKHFILPQHFPNRLLDNTNIIVVPFGGSVSGAFNGFMDGCLSFDNSNYELAITPGANFSSGTRDVIIYGYYYATLSDHFGRLSVN